MHPLPSRLALLAALCLSAPLAAEPRLVEDLNQGPTSDRIGVFLFGGAVAENGLLYFYGVEPAHGSELWRTDGTAAGTYRLTDVCPGRCEADPFQPGIVIDGRLFFAASDGVSGRELWTSDGTPGSERRVRDLCPGPCSSEPHGLVEVRGAVLFTATVGGEQQIWRTDGTRRGTTLVKAVSTGPTRSLHGLVKLGDRALFLIYDFPKVELWSTDGTPEGTVLVNDSFSSETIVQGGPIAAGDFAYLWTQDGLWRTDGTAAGTRLIKTAAELGVPEGATYWLGRTTVWNGLLLSTISYGKLIRSDGTPEGTYQILQLESDYSLLNATPVPAGLLFIDQQNGTPNTLRITRGTAETTETIFRIEGGRAYISDMVGIGDRALFRIQNFDTQAVEVWVTDGTSAGTRRLDVPGGTYAYDMASAGNLAYYPVGSYDQVGQLWRTDGTEAGTFPVLDLTQLPASSGPFAQAAFGDRLVFSAFTAPLEAPLFSSDGTGAELLSREPSHASGFTRVGNQLFFGSRNGLWRTDGTPGGTVQVRDDIIAFQSPVAFQGQLFFGGADETPPHFGGPDVELWRSDGRAATRVKDINPFQVDSGHHHICVPASSSPGPGVVIAGRLVFAADDGRNGRELWTSDGTRQGTRLLRDINAKRLRTSPPESCDSLRPDTGLPSDPAELVAFRGGALFTADDGRSGREIWWTNGTQKGTRRVADLRPGKEGSLPHDLVVFRGRVYFVASADGVGERLWSTDGTSEGTVLVDDLRIRSMPSWARSLTVSGGRLFFSVYNEATGAELWTSRGDAASTRLVADLRPGAPGSHPQELADAGGVLVFAADDGTAGLESWRSDGTAAGTVRLGDVNPGLDASSPGPFTRAGDDVFFGAFDAGHGREPRAIPLEEVRNP